MPPLVFPPAIAAVLAALGAASIARTLVREWRRINAELDQAPVATAEAVEIDRLPKLRPDPRTGVYRPE
jgi:hypothetical protein